jgi:hypothetical protein
MKAKYDKATMTAVEPGASQYDKATKAGGLRNGNQLRQGDDNDR